MSKKSPLVASALALAVSSAFAQSASETNNPLYQIASLDPVVVSASRYEEPRSIASAVVDVIDREQIEASGANNITEFLDQIPGVSVNRLYGRLGVDAGIDIGYLGEDGSKNVLVLIDGQRLNQFDNAGVRFAQLPISNIDRIEVRKANGGVLFGDRAQGGVINIITRQDNRKEADISVGSFGYRKAETYIGFGDANFFGSVSAMSAETDGYRDYSSADQESIRATLGSNTPLGKFVFSARAYDEDAQLPGSITRAQFAANPKQKGSTSDTQRSGNAFSGRYESPGAKSNGFVLDVFRQESKDKGYNMLRNNRTSFTPEYLWAFGSHKLIAGAELYTANADTDSKQQVSQTGDSIYFQASNYLPRGITADLGVRSQHVENEFQTTAGQPTTRSEARKNAVSLGVRAPLSGQTRIRAGVLTGYRFATADELYYFNSSSFAVVTINPNVKPMTSSELYAEVSHKYAIVDSSIHLRRIKTQDEIGYLSSCGTVSGTNVGCNTNLYDTTRNILTVSANLRLSNAIKISGSVDFIDAEINSGANSGKRVPLTPKRVGRISLEKTFENWSFSASGRVRDDMIQASDSANSKVKIPGRGVIDLGAKTSIRKDLSASFWVRNLADKSYYDYATSDGIYPADGRAVEASLRYTF